MGTHRAVIGLGLAVCGLAGLFAYLPGCELHADDASGPASLLISSYEFPVFEAVRFNDVAKARKNPRDPSQTVGKGASFRKFDGFEKADLEEKLLHWENDYLYRINNHNQQIHQKIFEMMAGSPNNSVWVDSGAHVCDNCGPVMRKLWQAGRRDIHLIAIDPDYSKCMWITRLRKELAEEFHDDDFVNHFHIVNRGLWNFRTRATLQRNAHGGAWSVKEDPKGTLDLVSIADVVAPTANFALWHLDAEGSEARAVAGLLTTSHRPVIIVEALGKSYDNHLSYAMLQLMANYSLVGYLPPNKDRVMFPPDLPDSMRVSF
jgi:hypothetical protein